MSKPNLSDVFMVMEDQSNISTSSETDPVKDLPKEFQKMEFVVKGNAKIGPDTWIMNMGSAMDCPSAKLGLCQLGDCNQCYARAPELMYEPKGILEKDFVSMSVDDIANKFTQTYSKNVGATPTFFKKGDFQNEAEAKKISDVIMKISSQVPSKKVIIATRRPELFGKGVKQVAEIMAPEVLKEKRAGMKVSEKLKTYMNWGIFQKATGPRAFRERQHIEFHALSADKIFADLMMKYKRAKIKPKYLRVSEAGDFYGPADVTKVSELGDKLKGIMKVYVYTARSDLKSQFANMSQNVCINGSGFLVHNMFKALDEEEYNKKLKDPKELKCAGDCRLCKLCINRHGREIYVLKHGALAKKK